MCTSQILSFLLKIIATPQTPPDPQTPEVRSSAREWQTSVCLVRGTPFGAFKGNRSDTTLFIPLCIYLFISSFICVSYFLEAGDPKCHLASGSTTMSFSLPDSSSSSGRKLQGVTGTTPIYPEHSDHGMVANHPDISQEVGTVTFAQKVFSETRSLAQYGD